MDSAKRKKVLWIAGGILAGLLILLVAVYQIALSSGMICGYWLPMVSRMTGQTISASDVRLSLLGKTNNLFVKNLRYSNGKGLEAVIDQAQGSIDFIKAASGEYRVSAFQVNGARAKLLVPAVTASAPAAPAPEKNASAPAPTAPTAPETKKPLDLLIRHVDLKNVVLEYEDAGKGVSVLYELDSLSLDQFGAGLTSDIQLASRLKAALKKTTLKVAPLPLSAKIQLKSGTDLMPEFLTAELDSNNTGLEAPAVELPDTAVPKTETHGDFPAFLRKCTVKYRIDLKNIVTADRMNLSIAGRMELADLVLKANPLNLDVNGMKCQLGGEVNASSRHFHVAGKSGAMDLSALLSSMMKSGSNPPTLMINSTDLNFKGQGFSEEAVKQTLTGILLLKASNLSIPMELYQSNDLTRVIMIPLRAIPKLLSMIPYEHALKTKAVSGARTLDDIFSGNMNLDFSTVLLDLTAQNGLVNIKNLSLTGNQVASEQIAGTVNLSAGNINLLTQTNLIGLVIPFRIGGTLASPQPDYSGALASLLKAVTVNVLQDAAKMVVKELNPDSASGQPVKSDGKVIEKAVEKGLNQLNNWLNNNL